MGNLNYLKLKKRDVVPNILLAAVLMVYILTFFNNSLTLSLSVYMTFFINFIIVVFGILKSELPLSLNKINWYFFLIFLIIIPFYQLSSGYAPRNMYLTEYEIIFTNILITLWCIGYYISYNFKSSDIKLRTRKNSSIPKRKSFYYLLLISSVICLTYAIATFGFENLFIRDAAESDEGTFAILIFFLLRAPPAFSLSIFLWTIKKKVWVFHKQQMYLMTLVLTVITFILNYPVSLSRFLIGAVYLGLIVSGFNINLFKGKRFDILLILSIVVIFPIMYAFKMYTLEQILSPGYTLEINNYNSVDFDAYQMIGRTIRFVERYGYQFGGQLRSVLLFFIPRDFMNIKGDPSGELVATIQNVSFTNLSSPIVAEGFIDFGVLGVFLYAFIFGKIAKFFDFKTYELMNDSKNIYFVEIVFSFLIGFFVYIYRGALQPTFLRLMGFYLFLMVIYMASRFRFSNKDKSISDK